MKTVKYTCDNCDKERQEIEHWLTIGSEDGGSLRIENNLPSRKIIKIGRHSDLHFCSAECLISYFVTKLTFEGATLPSQ